MMIKLIYIVSFTLLLFLGGTPAMAQFVNFRLELPAGVDFASQVIGPNPENLKEQLVWIELVTSENVTVLVDIQNDRANGKADQAVFFLNNGTSDFALAKKLEMGMHSLQLDQSGLLIRNQYPKTLQIKAWLGIPIQPGLITKIEYP